MIKLILFNLVLSTAQALSVAQTQSEFNRNPKSLRARVQLAEAFAEEKKYAKAVELLNPYTDQLDDEGFLLLGHSYSVQGDFENEVRVLNIMSARAEEDYRWHMLLGQGYLKLADTHLTPEKKKEVLTSAIQNLRRTLVLNKKFKPAFDLLLNTLLEQKANGDARELLIDGIQRFGERPEMLRELCRLDALDGYLVQAVGNCRRSIELSPTYPDHFVYLVQALHDQGEDTVAEQDIVAAARRFPKSEFVQWAAGTVFYRKKNFPVAARYFEAGVKANAKESRSLFGLAQSLFESDNAPGALPYFIAACKVDAATVETFLASGSKLKQRGKTDLGAKYLRAASVCR